jgi:hypothetical protein
MLIGRAFDGHQPQTISGLQQESWHGSNKNQLGEWNMKTSFRRLMLSLLVVLGSSAATSAVMADDFPSGKKVLWYSEMGNGYLMIGTVLNSGDNCCNGNYYFAYKPGAAIRMGLNTALEAEDSVAWFIKPGPNGSYEYVNANDFTVLELWRDPAGYPATSGGTNVPTVSSYNDIFLFSGHVNAYSPDGYHINNMITSQQWFGAFGDAIPIGALDGLLAAFATKTKFGMVGAAPVTQYEIKPCGSGFGC